MLFISSWFSSSVLSTFWSSHRTCSSCPLCQKLVPAVFVSHDCGLNQLQSCLNHDTSVYFQVTTISLFCSTWAIGHQVVSSFMHHFWFSELYAQMDHQHEAVGPLCKWGCGRPEGTGKVWINNDVRDDLVNTILHKSHTTFYISRAKHCTWDLIKSAQETCSFLQSRHANVRT